MKKMLMLFVISVAAFSLSTSSKAAADAVSWQKSVSIQPQSPTDFSSSTFDSSVNKAISDGANYVTLVIPVTQANIYSTQVYAGADTPTDASLISAVNYIHSKGASVAFTLHDDPSDGNWRAYINPSDRPDWFASYGSMLNHYAVLGQSLDVQEIVIGAELSDMTLPSANSTNTASWISLIQTVRTEYGGLLTYGAQHDGYMADDESLGFWPELDAIGIDAYYGLGNGDESVPTIESNWNQYEAEIQALSARYNKPVLFTEVGYTSQTNSLADPGSTGGGSADDSLQANAYQALFQYWQNYSFMKGMMLWDWSSDPNAGGPGDIGYTPQNKPAEQVMTQFFTSNSTASPTTPPASETYSGSSSASANPTTNSTTTVTSSVSATSTISNMLVDIEIYNAQGQQVFQTFYPGQTLSSTPTTYTSSFTPTSTDQYRVEIGVFTANWQANPYWNSSAGTINVSAPVTTPPPTTYPSGLDVWWPANGAAVSGVQPFQATLDGVDPSTYSMYWQVGNGGLNLMTTNMSPVAHKLAYVDLSGWDWSSNGQYTITFVAEDPSGKVIASKSEVITVN
jgi:hypothetical protein